MNTSINNFTNCDKLFIKTNKDPCKKYDPT